MRVSVSDVANLDFCVSSHQLHAIWKREDFLIIFVVYILIGDWPLHNNWPQVASFCCILSLVEVVWSLCTPGPYKNVCRLFAL